MVICLERGADLHTAQLMPLPLTVSCFSEIQIRFAFLVPAHKGSPGKRAVKWVCVCVWYAETRHHHCQMNCTLSLNFHDFTSSFYNICFINWLKFIIILLQTLQTTFFFGMCSCVETSGWLYPDNSVGTPKGIEVLRKRKGLSPWNM